MPNLILILISIYMNKMRSLNSAAINFYGKFQLNFVKKNARYICTMKWVRHSERRIKWILSFSNECKSVLKISKRIMNSCDSRLRRMVSNVIQNWSPESWNNFFLNDLQNGRNLLWALFKCIENSKCLNIR